MVRKLESPTEPGPLSRYPEGPPEAEATLPLMADMDQRTVGELTRSVDTLTVEQRELRTKMSDLSQKVHTAQTVVRVVGFLLMGYWLRRMAHHERHPVIASAPVGSYLRGFFLGCV